MKAPAETRRGIVVPTIFALVGVAILIGLGKWQLDRKVWKEDLIATVTARSSAPPESLPPRAAAPQLSRAADEYRRVTFSAEYLIGEQALVYTAGSAFRPDISGAGYWVFTPARLADGRVVVVNRGFVPFDRKALAANGQRAPAKVEITGALRWPEGRGLFTPGDDPQHNVWYVRDPRVIAAAKQWGPVAPFYVDQESPQPAGGWPRAGKLVVTLPDNHLQYALTWFALALGLIAVYGTWLARRLRA
ncbi:MAG TPA: SURF1 family protein [Pseudolabrys sp.]|nr:SURF1 family protein [Pseudolabrys sp.]